MEVNNVFQQFPAPMEKPKEKGGMEHEIVFRESVRELHLTTGPQRMERFVAVVCYAGKMQLEVNTSSYTIRTGQVLICHPDDMVCNAMVSPDFDGAVLSLAPKAIFKMFGESNLWDFFFHLTKIPVISLSGESMNMLRSCYQAFSTKEEMGPTTFGWEITSSIAKSVFYELMENIDHQTQSESRKLRHGEVLFKQFIDLLTGCAVKSRNVAWYASQLCITPKHLSTVCKRVSGKTAFEWINEYVIVDIRHLLKNSDKSIKEIVDLLKFPNVSFFGAYCRKHFGMTPMEYRKYLRVSADDNTQTPTL